MKSQSTVLHVINHTHWDREWFAPFTITRDWIPDLIRNLGHVVEKNPEYVFLFDGQTEVIEDLKIIDTAAYHLACKLIKSHNLQVGPYFVQVEMRNPNAESLIRNLRIGTTTAIDLGASNEFVAWDVDYFGHVTQSPQIHGLFGIKDLYLWRGPGVLAPFFWWHGPDGSTMLAIDLFAGGYRNFYKVTQKPDLALPRLEHEVIKLRPYYANGHIPVFDGFDLDQDPGDAASYFADHKPAYEDRVSVINSSAHDFAQTIRQVAGDYPDVKGELTSGKYSSVFPGTLSARTYSKLISDYIEQLLYRYAEPLNLLLPPNQYPEGLFEAQNKLILENLVHDVISGCSIDQVHDTAELRAQSVTKTLTSSIKQSLTYASGTLEDGVYSFQPGTGLFETQVAVKDQVYLVENDGVSISKVVGSKSLHHPNRVIDTFSWQNDHFNVSVTKDGLIKLGEGQFGQLVTQPDSGDTYWDEPKGEAVPMHVVGPLELSAESDGYAELTFMAEAKGLNYGAAVQATIIFDQSPFIKWRLQLESTGTGFSVLLRHNFGRPQSKLSVGMQFDNVKRNFEDTDLFGQRLDESLSSILIGGQRDVDRTFTFPFHSYISPANNPDRAHILAKGLRAYQTSAPGNIDLVLTRPVEWVMRPGFHKYHSGDAGPKFLVPGAKSERKTIIHCAILVHKGGPDTIEFHQAVDRFINPALLFEVKGSTGTETHLSIFNETAAISSLHQNNGQTQARIYNPTNTFVELKNERKLIDRTGVSKTISELPAKRIAAVTIPPVDVAGPSSKHPTIRLLNLSDYPASPDRSKPSPESLSILNNLHEKLKNEMESLESIIETYGESAPHALTHRYYVVAREYMEVNLSIKWNELRIKGTVPNANYEFPISEELKQLTQEYNDMRINRRMYDYIVGIGVNGERVAVPRASAVPK